MRLYSLATFLCSVLASVDEHAKIGAHRPFSSRDLVTSHKITDVEANRSGTKLLYNIGSYNAETNSTSNIMGILNVATGQTKSISGFDPDNSRFTYQWVDDSSIGFNTYVDGKLAFWVMEEDKWEPVKHFERKSIRPYASRFYLNTEVFYYLVKEPTREKDQKSFDSTLIYDRIPINDYNDSNLVTFKFMVKGVKELKPVAQIEVNANLRKEVTEPSVGTFIDALGNSGMPKNLEVGLGDDIPQTQTIIPSLSFLDPDSPISCFSPDKKKTVELKRANNENLNSKILIVLTDTMKNEQKILNKFWDASPYFVTFAKDGSGILIAAENKGQRGVYLLNLDNSTPHKITGDGSFGLLGSFEDGRIIVVKSSVTLPAELFELTPNKEENTWVERKLSGFNDELDKFKFMPQQPFYFKGANQDMVHGLMVKPPSFDQNKKYPMIALIRGGPHLGSDDIWNDYFNHQVLAQAGFIVAEINYHGSTGFGDNFAQSVVKHWGDLAYEDITLGTKYLIQEHTYIDGEKVAAWGHSFGGFLVNYLNGHNQDKLFKVFMSYAGIFDLKSSYYTSDLPEFFAYETGSKPSDIINTELNLAESLYHKFSPSTYVANWVTPTIVVHGKDDLRVKDSEGIATFTALKSRNIPSKFLYFQNEGHTLTEPANLIRFYNEGLNFTATYLNHSLPYAIPSFYVSLTK